MNQWLTWFIIKKLLCSLDIYLRLLGELLWGGEDYIYLQNIMDFVGNQ